MILHKQRLAFWTLVGIGVVALYALMLLFRLGVAHADAIADPVVAATAATDASWSLVAQYGPIWGVTMLVFGTLGAFLRANEAQHWLAQGRKLALIVGASSILAAVLDWHFHGAPVAGILITAVMAIKLVWSPAVAVAKTGPVLDATKASGTIGMLAVLCLGLAAMQPACGARPIATAGVGAFLDCEGDGIKSTVLELLGLAKAAVMSTISGDGKHVDTTAFRAAARGLKSDAGRCAFASAVAMLATPAPAKPGAPMSAGLEIDGAELRAAFESVRPEFSGAVFRTASGTL